MTSTTKNLGIVAPVPAGEWEAGVTYQKLNIVRHSGGTHYSSFMALQTSTAIEPDVTKGWESFWQVLVRDGIGGSSVVQEEGQSTTDIMSQKAVTDALQKRDTQITQNTENITANSNQISQNTNQIAAQADLITALQQKSDIDDIAIKTNQLKIANLEQALKGYVLDTANDKYSNMLNGITLHNSVTIGENVYPIANGTRMLVSKIEGKTAKMVQLLNKDNFPATYTESGVTITNNGDGTLIANGTATANVSIYLGTQAVAPIGTKWLVYDGGAGVGRANGYTTFINSSVGELASTRQNNRSNIYTATTEYTISAYIFIAKDTSVTNVIFKPQLFNLTAMYGVDNEPATTDEFLSDFPRLYGYENGNIYPTKITGLKVDGFVGSDYYSESIDLVRGKTLDETYELHGFGGVCDTFEITKNESDDLYTLTKVQRIKKLILNGTEAYQIFAGRIIGSYDADTAGMVVSNKYLYNKNVGAGIEQSISPSSFQYYITDTRFETVDAWKAHLAEQYAAGDPVVIYYKMTTPIKTVIFSNLTYEQVTLLYYNNLLFCIEGNTNDDYTGPTITNTVVCKLTATEA